jgi:hypothetical protein
VEEPRLPSFYYVEESDPDIMVLCRKDGSFVAAFSAREGIKEAAIEDYRELIRAQADSRGRPRNARALDPETELFRPILGSAPRDQVRRPCPSS